MEGMEGKEKQLRKSWGNKIIFAQPDPLFHPTLTACSPSCGGIGNNWELVFSSKYWTIWEQLVKKWHMEEPKHGKQARVKKVNRKEKFGWENRKDENVVYSDKGRKETATEGKILRIKIGKETRNLACQNQWRRKGSLETFTCRCDH